MMTICRSLGPICGSVITVGLQLGLRLGLGFGLGFDLIRVRVMDRVADYGIQTAGESDKMRINHATETDQWRAAP